MQVEPQNTIPLIYQITDPSDSTVYYIRAVAYDSLTRTALSTNNLVSRGSGLWSSTMLAPVDSTGLGRHIHVIIKVYTDSGYTTLSDIYTQQIDKYLVKSSRQFGGGGGGGLGNDIDYNKIKQMVSEVLQPVIKSLKEEKKNDTELNMLKKINKSVSDICEKMDSSDDEDMTKKEPPEPIDFSPVIKEIQGIGNVLSAKVDGITIPDKEYLDFSFKGLEDKIEGSIIASKDLFGEIKNVGGIMNDIKNIVENLISSFTSLKKEEEKTNKLKEVVKSFLLDGSVPPVKSEEDIKKEQAINKYFNV